MIEEFNTNSKIEYCWLLEFLNGNVDYDFYYTHKNSRIYISDFKSLKNFLRQSERVFTLKENGMYVGIILVWKSFGGGKNRYYIKLNAKDARVARNLLTVLLWNTERKLFVKVRKDSPFLSVFKTKGFKFIAGRGIQTLLCRKPLKTDKIQKNLNKENNNV